MLRVDKAALRSNGLMRAALSALAVLGLIALLVASHYQPAWATALRWLAFVWFFGFGAVRVGFDLKAQPWRRRPGRRSDR